MPGLRSDITSFFNNHPSVARYFYNGYSSFPIDSSSQDVASTARAQALTQRIQEELKLLLQAAPSNLASAAFPASSDAFESNEAVANASAPLLQ